MNESQKQLLQKYYCKHFRDILSDTLYERWPRMDKMIGFGRRSDLIDIKILVNNQISTVDMNNLWDMVSDHCNDYL